MTRSSIFLAIAGGLGLLTAVIHGIIMQRHMIRPLNDHLADHRVISRPGRALLSPLLHVSTLAWALAGLALLYSTVVGNPDMQELASGMALVLFLYAALANAMAVKALHPGWILIGMAACFIVAAQF